MTESLKGRQASLAFIVVTVFLDVLGFGLIIPVLPKLVGQLTSSPDQQAYWYGLLAAFYGVMQFFCSPILGALSDRYGRRPILLLSNFGLACSFFVHATATTLIALLLVRIISGGTAASFSVANAYVADITEPSARGKAFGKLGAAFGVGFIFGPLLGGLLGEASVRLPFFVAGSLALCNALYGYFVLPESLTLDKRAPFSLARANPFAALWSIGQLKGLGPLVGVFALSAFAQFILHSTWVLYTEFRYGWGPSDNGMALFAVGLSGALVQGVLLGRLLKRFGERRLALLGMGLGALAYLLYGLADQGWMMYTIIGVTCLSAVSAPSLQAIVTHSVAPTEQGLTQGAFSAINSLAIVFAPLLGTSLLAGASHLPAQDWRMGGTFFICAGLQLAAMLLCWRHFTRARKARLAL